MDPAPPLPGWVQGAGSSQVKGLPFECRSYFLVSFPWSVDEQTDPHGRLCTTDSHQDVCSNDPCRAAIENGFFHSTFALSVDPQEEAQALIDKLQLTFSIGYGFDFMEFAKKTGAFYKIEESRQYLHATGFILRLDGTIAQAVYATGKIGRFMAADCLRVIKS